MNIFAMIFVVFLGIFLEALGIVSIISVLTSRKSNKDRTNKKKQ